MSLTVIAVAIDAQRSSLRIDVVDHDLAASTTRYDLFTICREPNTPDLDCKQRPSYLDCLTHAEVFVAPPVADAPVLVEVETSMFRIQLVGAEHVHKRCNRRVNHPGRCLQP